MIKVKTNRIFDQPIDESFCTAIINNHRTMLSFYYASPSDLKM